MLSYLPKEMIHPLIIYSLSVNFSFSDGPAEKPLKLTIKVGGQSQDPGADEPESPQAEERSRHKHKKKKKKKSSDKDRERVSLVRDLLVENLFLLFHEFEDLTLL